MKENDIEKTPRGLKGPKGHGFIPFQSINNSYNFLVNCAGVNAVHQFQSVLTFKSEPTTTSTKLSRIFLFGVRRNTRQRSFSS